MWEKMERLESGMNILSYGRKSRIQITWVNKKRWNLNIHKKRDAQQYWRVMDMFSEELHQLDRNTVQYMIDQMQEEIEEKDKKLEEKDRRER